MGVTRSITEMIVKDVQPLSVVDGGHHFKILIKTIDHRTKKVSLLVLVLAVYLVLINTEIFTLGYLQSRYASKNVLN